MDNWRLVLVHQAIPKLRKITLDRPYYEAIGLIVRAIYQCVNQEASAFKPRWRPSCLNLL